MACAHRIARLPKGAVEDTKRIINIQLERAVLAALDFALERGGPVVHDARAPGQPRPALLDSGERVEKRVTPAPASAGAVPARCCAARSASQSPSASPAVSTCASAMARAAGPSPRVHRVEQRGVLRRLRSLLLGEELEVVARHDPHGLAQIGEQAGRAGRQVEGAVEAPVGRDHVVGARRWRRPARAARPARPA